MRSKSAEKVKLSSFDDLFGKEETVSGEVVTSVPIDLLHPFKNHPFHVLDDEKMEETVESVKQYGILMPGIVRPYPDGGYEVVAGHRRWRACELAGLEEMPVIIRDIDDDTATVIMVDTNIQREDILPSEKAFAYKMKYEALKHQGSKGEKYTAEMVGETAGDSGRTVQRYIRLANLISGLLDLVDVKKVPMIVGEKLSYLTREEQELVRACEDVDDTALSYAEIKALATGNPYIKEKMDLDIQVSKLKLLKANHTSQKYKLETDIAKNYPMQIAAQKERLAGLRSDAEAVRPIFENEDFSMIVSNKTFTDKKEAGTALLAACEGLKAIHTEGKIGTFHDFSLYAKFDAFNQRYIMTIKRKCSYLIEMGKDILGNLQRISNALGGIEKKMEETEQKLETLQKQLETAQEEAAKPFPKEKELQEKMERLAELNSLLNMDEKEMPQDQEKEVDQVADLPRRSVNYAGRVSEGRKGKIEKSSVLGRLKTTQRNMEKGWKNRDMQKKKQEQQL